MTDLTDKQMAFLDALFGAAEGDIRKAMDAAGYARNTPESHVVGALVDEIVDRSRRQIGAHAAKATFKAMKLLDDPTALGAEKALSIVKEIWDRSGIVKKDKLEVSGELSVGLFVLPAKAPE